MLDPLTFTRTSLYWATGRKRLISQHRPEDTPAARERRHHRMRFVFGKRPCLRGRICTGNNCPCNPNVHLDELPQQN